MINYLENNIFFGKLFEILINNKENNQMKLIMISFYIEAIDVLKHGVHSLRHFKYPKILIPKSYVNYFNPNIASCCNIFRFKQL
ncbi:hypothetical protein BpHYR1_034288 [Brachionus plicatilis]|uniref:Uncharacterized protein n=1 Tax=Brachionus plicatilis TaxID=10195 RepID=A0A3M7RV04_BRAPC|nr:hypothetical protein BpHYR1_034288 [Brachionus plicatilis]